MIRFTFSRLGWSCICALIIYVLLYKSLRGRDTSNGPFTSIATNTDLEVTDKAYFEVTVSNQYTGKFIIGLFGNIVPKTVKNFIAFAQGFKSIHNGQEVFLTYRGTKFHRIIRSFMVQGGAVLNRTGGISLFGEKFPDENFVLKHSSEGWVSMANSGVDSNGCQFFITLEPTPWLDDHHVVFGKVLEGMEVVKVIANVKTNSNDAPEMDVIISQCGLMEPTSPLFITI